MGSQYRLVRRGIVRPIHLKVVADFNQVEVRIAQVNGTNCTHGAGAHHRPLLNLTVSCIQVGNHILKRDFGDEAQISGPRSRVRGLGIDLSSCLVEIDFLLSKSERLSIAERDHFHPQGRGVESNGRVDVGYGENQVIEMVDNESHIRLLNRRGAACMGRNLNFETRTRTQLDQVGKV
jgi:hypothetical protein